MPKVTTDLELRMRSEGVAKVAADTQALGQKGQQAMAKVNREVQNLESEFKKLTDKQLELNKQMSEMDDKGGKAYKALQKNMSGVQREAAQVERTLKNVQRAYKETDATADQAAQRRKREQQREVQEARRGSFRQGLLQGLIPEAAYLQRGPGMARQAMGAALGGRARAGAAGLGQIPFSGAAGLAQALQSIPGGGFIAAPMMQSVQYAQQALQFRQQRQEMAPFLQMGGRTGRMIPGQTLETAMQNVMQRATSRAFATPTEDLPLEAAERMLVNRGIRESGGRVIQEGDLSGAGRRGQQRAMRARMVQAAGGEDRWRDAVESQAVLLERKRIATEISDREDTRARRARAETVQDVIRRQGAKMGYAMPQAMQMMGGITQAGGGVGRELGTQQLGMAGMAAQRLYGIGPEVTGAFLQAGRRGGAVGAQGRGGAAMTEAIAGGMRMGLEGSELTNWMSQMAGDIRNWQQTGIPINPGSVNALGASMARMGLGGIRGGAVARGITSRAQELSTRGPQGAEELILMQELGGLQGTGVGAFEEAQLRMEQGEFTGEDVRRAAGRFMGAGGGGAGGRAVFRRAMRRFGVNVGVAETRLLEKQITGQQLTPDEEVKIKAIDSQIAQVAGGAPESVGAMGRKAIQQVDPVLKRQASQTNQQLATGGKMINFMQDMEDTTRKVAAGFTTLAAAPLTELSGGIKDLADQVPRLANRIKAMASGDVTALVTSSGEAQ